MSGRFSVPAQSSTLNDSPAMQKALLALHLLGLAMGLSVPFSNIIMGGLIEKAAPNEKSILARFPQAMARVGDIGLALLWLTGPTMLFRKYGGMAAFSSLGWTFHVKLTAVVVLTLGVGYIHSQMKKAFSGDQAAMGRIRNVGKITLLSALTAMVFAVLTFEPSM